MNDWYWLAIMCLISVGIVIAGDALVDYERYQLSELNEFHGFVQGFNFGLEEGWKQGWNEKTCPHWSISDYLGDIEEIPPQFRGCYLNYYMENYHERDMVHFEYHNDSRGPNLFNEDGRIINCSKYGGG